MAVSWPHPRSSQSQSKIEDDHGIWLDPKTAHAAVGDAEYAEDLPFSCLLCRAAALSEAQAQVAKAQETIDAD